MRIMVLGSGAWGTALAMLLSDNQHAVTLWSHNTEKAQQLAQTRENPLLPGVTIPASIHITSDLTCLQEAQLVVFAVPSFALRETAHKAAPFLPDGAILVSVTKGIERGTHLRMSEIVREETGGKYSVAVLSGPSHAEEVARRLPTGCVVAAQEQGIAETQRVAAKSKTSAATITIPA